MKQFYVKDLNKLSDFGFTQKDGRYWLKIKRTPNIWVCKGSNYLTFQSPSKDCIAVVCEMYKQGAIEILDENKEGYHNMAVTEEEAQMIYEYREQKRAHYEND